MSERSDRLLLDHLELYRRMWVLRLLDMALQELRIEGLMKTPVTAAFGQEAVGIGAAGALCEGDIVITTHRAHAQHVGVGGPVGSIIAALLARAGNELIAADEPPLVAHPIAGMSAPSCVVEQSPLLAIGHAYRQWVEDSDQATLCITEDGDVDTGAFNETANLAVVWQLPVVILVENIRCALSVCLRNQARDTQLYRKAAAYGMPGVSVDGNDVAAVRDAVGKALARARDGGGPTLVQAITYRTTDFSGSDRGGYRDLVGSEQFLDPLIFARKRLLACGARRTQLDDLERAARHLVGDAVAVVKAGPRLGNRGLGRAASRPDGPSESRG
ncbi:thiamine pyrophosphate-dependent dehydrogenase E1 component subunit alpha [Mycobacterium simiae]|uniref:Thiamine pyrophosphate-dependent dehydrogenase E1 component subunit alpha n=1 Tax=Mycobacterium simiae TaxID=1784 RepID=A0A5B1BW92_MYCSI|nr:thiamine pyrophosphate-dependent enzyme [Mycobacterium simiae]KAA1251504.1 thiamine pyrophosphate-dependent dehydrogenase E1 component subunit alpha [Mycobacterium simiae]